MTIRNEISIKADYDTVFKVSNDIEKWPEMFDEYTDAKIIKREGNKITFQLSHENGKSWTSWRLLDKENKKCHAERIEPMFPFTHMFIDWYYEEKDHATLMIWEQDFEMDENAKLQNEQARDYMNKHSVENMQNIKQIIEKMVNK